MKEALPVCRRQVSPQATPAGTSCCAPLTRIVHALQILARQQVEKTRQAFVEYQQAHDAHAEAKAAAAAVENQLMASSGALPLRCRAAADDVRRSHPPCAGGSVVDTDLLSQSSDLASRVVETESRKLKAERVHAAEARYAPRSFRAIRLGSSGAHKKSTRQAPVRAVQGGSKRAANFERAHGARTAVHGVQGAGGADAAGRDGLRQVGAPPFLQTLTSFLVMR